MRRERALPPRSAAPGAGGAPLVRAGKTLDTGSREPYYFSTASMVTEFPTNKCLSGINVLKCYRYAQDTDQRKDCCKRFFFK